MRLCYGLCQLGQEQMGCSSPLSPLATPLWGVGFGGANYRKKSEKAHKIDYNPSTGVAPDQQ